MLLFVALLITVSLLALLFGKLLVRGSQNDADRIDLLLSGEAVADHYRPLSRLLNKKDCQYLSAQPGMTPQRIRHFRAQRRKLFRQYLSNLIGDFGAVCFLVKALMVQSPIDRPDLAQVLSKLKTTFYLSLAKIHFQLFMHAVGLSTLSIETGELTRALEALTAQARLLQLSPAPSLA